MDERESWDTSQEGTTVVALPGEVDIGNSGRIGEDLRAALGPGVSVVVADMTATTFCDSSAIRALVIARDQAVASGAELRLAVARAPVRRILAVMGVDRLLPVYPSLGEALTAVPAAPPAA